MESNRFVLELGSNSLKFHLRDRPGGEVRKLKFPWKVGYDVGRTGALSAESLDDAVCSIQALLGLYGGRADPASAIAFATGIFREAEGIAGFVEAVRARTGVLIRVISSDQEAALLEVSYSRLAPPEGGFAFDLGSGSLQWVHLSGPGRSTTGSLPLGVIRLLVEVERDPGAFLPARARDLAERALVEIPRVRPREVVGTGGTVKALARTLGTRRLARGDLEALRLRTLRDGLPPGLRDDRRPLFLPGLLIVEGLLDRIGAPEVRHEDLSVGRTILEMAEAGEPDPLEVRGSLAADRR
jgi:exopolyphosphatase / guanosine-5'-triphosphate,3'-diphosphate pyrophosphatase